MKKTIFYRFGIILLMLALLQCSAFASVNPSPYNSSTMRFSRVDLRRYFEKAMSLFESAKYEEAIAVFENLIQTESSQNESYFTPFAEIYIDKSKARMREMILVKDRRWEKMKKDVINEAERIAKEAAQRVEEEKKKKVRKLEEEIGNSYEKAMSYYKDGRYPESIVEFKNVIELDPEGRLAKQANSFIEKMQLGIRKREEAELFTRMEAAREAKIAMDMEDRRIERERESKRLEKDRLERRKGQLKKIFEERLKARTIREKIARIENLMDGIRRYAREDNFEKAGELLSQAMAEFPENRRFKDIAHYVEMEKIKFEEEALTRAREITEERMLLEVAEKHILPEEKDGVLEKKKITPIVRVPEIRKRLKIPISVDFKDVELDYVLGFLSDATGVNIVPSSEIDTEEKKVSIKIKDMPLEEALRYILKSQDLVYRIEEDAVWVATKEELENENIETRVYFLDQGLGRFTEFTGKYDSESGDSASTEVKTVKDILENAVDWPKDSKLTMDERTGALIISNIPSNLGIIENLIYSLDVTPVQVLIEARFLEVKVTDLDELGIDWKLNSAWGTTQNNEKQNVHGLASDSGVNFSDFSSDTKDYGFNLTYQGILSHPQFQMVMHAFQQKQNVKTLSAPRITTLNNQTATIQVIDEYIYPTRYEVSLVQYDINGDGDFDDAGETEWANIPQDFVTRDVGILLHVRPSVGVDSKTITLALTPEVSEQDSTTTSYSYAGSVSIPNFKTRNLSTSVIVESGETVVMGGLMSESNTNTKTKVPLLGDLPLVGGLFRKNEDSVERRNLLIFVTASVLNEENIMASVPEKEQINAQR